MPFHYVTITDQLAWLPDHTGTAAATVPGLPAGYRAYLKLLPPLGIDRSVPITEYSFACGSVAELNARAAFWTKYGIVQGQPAASRLQPITHQEIAASLGLAYGIDFDSAAISRAYGGHWPPYLGSSSLFTAAFAQRLTQVMGPATEAYFYGSQEEGNGIWDSDGCPADWLALGTLADLPEIYREDSAFPTYVFAADHSWCFYQAELVDWLAFGGPAEVANVLLASPGMEGFRLA